MLCAQLFRLPLAISTLSYSMTLVLFPNDPLRPRTVEEDFESELSAARNAGFEAVLLDHTRVADGSAQDAVAHVPENEPFALYRGWMLAPERYEQLHAALKARGTFLINTPEAYRTCHYLPESYRWLDGHTPRSAWLRIDGELDFASVAALLKPFGKCPLVLKDYVKSQKHYWKEACFIPAADDLPSVERVVRRFLELQGDDLNVGLVFREFVPLKIVGVHPKSNMPLAAEFRSFWFDGEPILAHRYWGDLTSFESTLPFDELRPLAARIPSRFFTMDVAYLEDGSWIIVELGDGQVAGLPSNSLAHEFFEHIAKAAARA